MSGWIKLHREITEHWLWECEPFSKGQAWVDLILHANFSYSPKKIMIKGKLYILFRGQQARSELTLAKTWKWSRNKVRRFLKKLENETMMEQHSDNKTSIITILNFDKYQKRHTAGDTAGGTAGDTAGDTATEQQAGHSIRMEEGKEGKEEIKEEEEQNGPKPNMANAGQGINDGTCPDNSSSLDRDCLPDSGLAIENRDDEEDNSRNGKVVKNDVSGNLHSCLSGPDSVNHLDNQDDKGIHLVVSRGDEQKKVVKNELEKAEKDKVKSPLEEKKPKKKKNGVALDLSKVDPLFDTAIVEEFIEYRKVTKKNPLTQRALDGVCRNTKKVKEKYGGTENDVLIYAMEQKWLTPDTKYVDDNPGRYRTFLDDQSGIGENKEDSVKEKIADLERRAKIAKRKWEEDQRAANA